MAANIAKSISLLVLHQKFDRVLMPFQILYHVIQCLNTHNVNMIHICKYGIQQSTYAVNNDSTELCFQNHLLQIIRKYIF